MSGRQSAFLLVLVGLGGLLCVSDADACRRRSRCCRVSYVCCEAGEGPVRSVVTTAPLTNVVVKGVCYKNDGVTPQANVKVTIRDAVSGAVLANTSTAPINPTNTTGNYLYQVSPGSLAKITVTYTPMGGTESAPILLSTSQNHTISPVMP